MYLTHSRPPRFSEAEIKKIAKDRYDLRVSVSHLVSDIGQNFYLKDDTGKEYILKIANPVERKEILEAQNKVLHYLAKQEQKLQFPRVCLSKHGNLIETIKDQKNRIYNVRLLTYIHGHFLAEVQPHSPELLYNLGQFLGRLDKALQDFHHPATLRYWHWDLKHAMDLNEYIHHIQAPHRKRLCEYFLLQFEHSVLPKLPELRSSVIHNDANDHNILINTAKKGEKEVIGMIDFGDIVWTHTIFELAIALAYVMLDKDDPLTSAIPVIQGYHDVFPLKELELEVLFYSITSRLCNSVIMAAYQKQIQKDNEYLSISEEASWTLLEKMLSVNIEKANRLFRKACNLSVAVSVGKSTNEIIRKRNTYVGKSLSISYQRPLKITRGAMQYLFDEGGNTYLDCVNNVCHVGHCHPHVVKTAQKQMSILNTNTRYLHDHLVQYAQRLTKKMPESLSVCYFVNSGSEANELALRLASIHTGQKDCIVLESAYHGHTSSLIELSPYKFDGPGGKGKAPHIHKVMMPDTYRGPYKKSDQRAGENYAKYVQESIREIKNDKKGLSAFFYESLPGCAGQIVLPDGYLKAVFEYVHDAGGVCIADEVQVGFGRVGTHFWGFETQEVVPDIVTLGKPIGNGHPLGAVITRPEIAESFDNGMEYFNTFGGNPVSCAVGMAVLDVIENEGLQKNALLVGNYFKEALNKLKEKHVLIGDVRGMGLFIGVELVLDREKLTPAANAAKYIVERMKEEGILLSIDGPFFNVLKIKPPIVFTRENANFVVDTFEKVLQEPELLPR